MTCRASVYARTGLHGWRRDWLPIGPVPWSVRQYPHQRNVIHVAAVFPRYILSMYLINPLECRGNSIATSNSMMLVHWPLMGGLLPLVHRGGDWAGPQPAQAPPRCTKCNSPLINGQCTSHRIDVRLVRCSALLMWLYVQITKLHVVCAWA